MAEVDLKWLESTIKENGFDVSKLISVKLTPAVEPGENYISMVYRLAVEALTNNGKQKQFSLILKRAVEMDVEETIKEKIKEAFALEYTVYVDILPQIGKFMPKQQNQWPDCLGSIPGHDIYFEDLTESGHSLAVRQNGLDNAQCLLMFENLANFHAASCLAVDKGKIDMTRYKQYIMLGTATLGHRPKTNEFELLSDVILKDWGHGWEKIADRLNKYSDRLDDIVFDIGIFDEKRFNVFNHGDTWVNNFMFKYDSTGKLDSVKFVDFQIAHYNTFGFDICYLLSSSIGPELKKKNLNSWIETYCNTFSKCLDEHCSSLARPTPDLVKSEIARLSPFSLLISMRIRPVIMAPREHRITIPELLQNLGVDSKRRRVYANPNYIHVMKSDLPEYLSNIESVYKESC